MSEGIKFNKDGCVARCGREIDPPSWIAPNEASFMSMEEGPCMCPGCRAYRDSVCKAGAEDICVDVLCPCKTLKADAVEAQQGIVGTMVRQGISRTRLAFIKDLSKSMINVGHGYDPYDHVGHFIVARMLGVEL